MHGDGTSLEDISLCLNCETQLLDDAKAGADMRYVKPVLLQLCLRSAGYQIARSRPCSTFQCYSQADCSNHGFCNSTSKACTCSAGYVGPSCNIFTGPCSAPSPAPPAPATARPIFCCPTGVVDHLGVCCDSGEDSSPCSHKS